MMRSIKPLWLLVMFNLVLTASPALCADETPIKLETAHINTRDISSIQRGAKYYAAYCLSCHSLKYMDLNPIAKSAGIVSSKMPDKNKNWWFGAAPPDLTLIAKVHGRDWLYTYLHVFYKDTSRPFGTNNLLLYNVNMPNPFLALQGEQILQVNKKQFFSETPFYVRKLPYFTVLKMTRQGSLSPDEFDAMVRDLVNFLVYASEPQKSSRERLGIGVLIFLVIFFWIVYLLKKEIWKDQQ